MANGSSGAWPDVLLNLDKRPEKRLKPFGLHPVSNFMGFTINPETLKLRETLEPYL